MDWKDKIRSFAIAHFGTLELFANFMNTARLNVSRWLSRNPNQERKPGFEFFENFVKAGGDVNWLLNENDERTIEELTEEIKYDVYGYYYQYERLVKIFETIKLQKEKIQLLDKAELLELFYAYDEAYNIIIELYKQQTKTFEGIYKGSRLKHAKDIEERTDLLINKINMVLFKNKNQQLGSGF